MGGEFVWEPTPEMVEQANLTAFMRSAGMADYDDLLVRADQDPDWFWNAVIEFFDIRFSRNYDAIIDRSSGAEWARWCVGGATNIVSNCLERHLGTPTANKAAIVWEAEDGTVRTWSHEELYAETCRLAEGLRSLGLGRGDVIGLYMPMIPETAAAFFAIARIGAIVLPLFSGFGASAVSSRLSDGGARAAITVDGTRRRGKLIDMKSTIDEAAAMVPTLEHVVVLETGCLETGWTKGRDHRWGDLTAGRGSASSIEVMSADDPLMVIFTSGTTGKAKGTVHTHCGFLTKLAADFGLTGDFKADDRFLWMSDLGWLVGPMQLVVTTFFGATLVLAEGAPDYPDSGRLWRLVADHRVTYLGVAPTIVRAMMRNGTGDVERHDLSSLRLTVSSGELWTPEAWTWFFENVCRRQAPIINISGGTEIGWGILYCTVLHPQKPCCFTTPCLGMGVEILDARGEPVADGTQGELALRLPSIGLTRSFWNDDTRYLETYWSKIPGKWVHGDWASREEDGTWFLHGRSDDTIMIAGKRCGPSEVESLLLEPGLLTEAAATAISDPIKGEALLCVCVAAPGIAADDELRGRLRGLVEAGLGPAFRPKDLLFVTELPKTRSMKVMRRVVRAIYEGRDPGDLAALANPDAIEALRRTVQNP